MKLCIRSFSLPLCLLLLFWSNTRTERHSWRFARWNLVNFTIQCLDYPYHNRVISLYISEVDWRLIKLTKIFCAAFLTQLSQKVNLKSVTWEKKRKASASAWIAIPKSKSPLLHHRHRYRRKLGLGTGPQMEILFGKIMMYLNCSFCLK